MEYFSDRAGTRRVPRTFDVAAAAWEGLVALVDSKAANGWFGNSFPEMCPDGEGPVGTDSRMMGGALRGDVPELGWPLRVSPIPDVSNVMDLVEFCHTNIAKPRKLRYHDYYRHHHLGFDSEEGRREFRDSVNRIFLRNGMGYRLESTGHVQRILSPGLEALVAAGGFDTGDPKLDALMADALHSFLDPRPDARADALRGLWDAFERSKTLLDPGNKKAGASALLDRTEADGPFRDALDAEAHELTRIGNSFHIRHSEHRQTELSSPEHQDYLFYRLLAFLRLVLPNAE